MATDQQYVLLTGSDLGNRLCNLQLAYDLINKNVGVIEKSSDVFESEPWGFESETKFLNQALLVKSLLKPLDVLERILGIEKSIGRVRTNQHWISRIIDIDILCAEQNIFHTSELTIPHKLLHERPFALEPLCQIVDWKHPLLKRSYKEILSGLLQKPSKTTFIVD